ncbi:hypothetical protein COBT_000125 [Conglomerata obtusa]
MPIINHEETRDEVNKEQIKFNSQENDSYEQTDGQIKKGNGQTRYMDADDITIETYFEYAAKRSEINNELLKQKIILHLENQIIIIT